MKNTLSLLIILTTFNSYTQTSQLENDSLKRTYKNDVSLSMMPIIGGASFNGEFMGRLYLEYRRQIAPTFYLKANVSTRDGDRTNAAFDVYVNDTSRLRPVLTYSKSYTDFRLGIDKEFNDGLVGLGASMIFGGSNNGSFNHTKKEYLDTTYNVWYQDFDNCSNTPSSVGLCDYASSTTSFIDIGMSLNINLNLRITERWGFHIKYEPQFKYRIRQKTSEHIHGDPYTGIIEPISFQRASHQEFRHNVDLNLRFKF